MRRIADGDSSAGQRPPILADRPDGGEEADALGFMPYADALAAIIDGPGSGDTPLTIAISGPLGAGKTTLAMQVERRLAERTRERGAPQHVICWFDAWMHHDAPQLGAAFAAQVARAVNRRRPLWRRLVQPLPVAMLTCAGRQRRRTLLAVVCALAVVATMKLIRGVWRFASSLLVSPRLAQHVTAAFSPRQAKLLLAAVVLLGAARWLFGFARTAARYVDEPRSAAAEGSMHEVSQQLRQLVHQATRRWGRQQRRLVMFVDNLDRCQPFAALDICEVASQLFGHEDIVTVLVADMAAITAAAQRRYADVQQPAANGDHPGARWPATASGRLYLEKMVQVQFVLPVPLLDSIQTMLAASPRAAPPQPRSRLRLPRWLGTHPRRPDWLRGRAWLPSSDSAGGILAVASAAAVGWAFAAHVTTPKLLVVAGVAGLLAFGLWLAYSSLEDRRSHAAMERIDRQIRDAAMTSPDAEPAHLLDSVRPLSDRFGREIVRQRVNRFLVEDSPQRMRAEKWLAGFVPPMPRAAKRMVNQLRLVLAIAAGRGILDGPTALDPEHLAKWVGLLERWPAVAQAVQADRGLLVRLEAVKNTEELSGVLEAAVPDCDASQDLLDLLREPPRLAPHADRLVSLATARPKLGPQRRGHRGHSPARAAKRPRRTLAADSADPGNGGLG